MGFPVVVGYCHGQKVDATLTPTLLDLMGSPVGKRLVGGVIHLGGLYIDDNRDLIAAKFLAETDAEWLWMLDTDIIFPPEVLEMMLESAHPQLRPILSALYVGRMDGQTLTPIWCEIDPDTHEYHSVKKLDPSGPQELNAVGMGCCLIHRSVLEAMREVHSQPWYWFGRDLYLVEHEDGTEEWKRLGEDQTFCKRAWALGFPTHGDCRIQVGHTKPHVYSVEDLIKEGSIRLEPKKEPNNGKQVFRD